MATLTFTGMKPDDLKKLLKAQLATKVEACAILLQNEMKIGLSAEDNLSGSRDSAESAGGFPFKVTGRLAGSVSRFVDKTNLIARVGSNLLYGKFLQQGTRKMVARPFLTIAYNACLERMQRILRGK